MSCSEISPLRSEETSLSFSLQCSHHVFLSFRGEDTRKTFTGHLYAALLGAGLRTYRDNNDIVRGKNIWSEIVKAIEGSRSSIIVFSKNYATSTWCLEELLRILHRFRTSRHVILPVFFDVKPSHVRKQSKSFADAFGGYERQIEMEIDERKKGYLRNKVDEWKAALGEVATLRGMDLKDDANGDESIFIQKIVKEIADLLNHRVLNVARYLVGVESRAESINLWLQDESLDVNMAVIYGMGGIGKTTVAKFVYNLNFERFEGSSFLSNIREISEQPNGLVQLQKQLLSDIFKRDNEKINNVDEGIIRIKDVIGGKKVLVVLDDVDDQSQFDAIIGMCKFFHPGSKIILTTRHQNLFKEKEVHKMHEVKKLSHGESLELFSWHAFEQDCPVEDYLRLSEKVVRHCGGLPLALEVLGSSLSVRRSLDEWEIALGKLEAIPKSKILKKLKISYDSLEDDHDQKLFLHIACSFIGKKKYFVSRILDRCGFHTVSGMQNLTDRCLLKINEHDDKLMMHQLLRDMGREVVRQECTEDLGERSRLRQHKESYEVLKYQIGTKKIQALFLDLRMLEEEECSNRSSGVRNAKRRRLEEVSDQSLSSEQGKLFKWPRFSLLSRHVVTTTVINSDQLELKTDAFTMMRNLQLLQLNYVELKGGYKDFPQKLRWLCWHGFPLTSIPSDFPLGELVALDLRHSKLVKVWKETEMLKFLSILNLGHSHALANCPDFSYFPNLEQLILKDCRNLVGLHKSIGKLERLLLLNLKGCKKLLQLPSEIVQLKFLEKLILSDCSRLNELPTDLCKMESLTVLHADGINQLCSTTGEDKSLRKVVWNLVSKPRSNPRPILFSLTSLPSSLISLNIANCNLCNDSIQGVLGSFPKLQEVDLSGNPICSLPGWLKGLPCLRTLKLNDCIQLQSLPELPTSLKNMSVAYCRSLELMTNLPNLFTDLILDATNCSKLVEVQGLLKLKPVGKTDSDMINKLDLAKLHSYRMLEVNLYNFLTGTSAKSPIPKELYEIGIHSIFIPGGEIPIWFDKKVGGGSSISFTIPSLPVQKFQGLNVCVVFAFASALGISGWAYECISVNNKTKDLIWSYCPIFRATRDKERDLMWLSDWKIANLLMEAGDEVIVSLKMTPYLYYVKEFGIRIIHNEERTQNVNIDFSKYDMGKGDYLLFNGCKRDRDLLYSKICRSQLDCLVTRGMLDDSWSLRAIKAADE